MVAVNGVTNTTSVSVYRQMNNHLTANGATKVMPSQASPDATYRNMSGQTPVVSEASRQYAQKLYAAQKARYLPGNLAMEQAVQNRMHCPQDRCETQKTLDAVRDLRSGIYAGRLPASVVAEKQRRYDMKMRVNGYV